MTILQDDINAVVASAASIKKTQSDTAAQFNTFISVVNALPKSPTKNKLVAGLTPVITQFNLWKPASDALTTQLAKLNADDAPQPPPTPVPVPDPAPTPAPIPPAPVPATGSFKRLKIGGGGFVMGMSISKDGATKVIHTDSGGASIWNGQWDQLITADRMPAADFGVGLRQGGCVACIVAPSDSTRIYMFAAAVPQSGWPMGYVYVSSDRGAKFIRSALPGQSATDPNTVERTAGPKMMVDPANPDICYVSTPNNGVFRTLDGGASWSPVNVPISTGNSHVGMVFDPSSPIVNGRTQGVYIFSQGLGLYRSTDGGLSFSPIPGGPAWIMKGKIALDGVYYCTNDGVTLGDHPAGMWRYNGAWAIITPAGSMPDSVCLSTFEANKVYCINNGGSVYVSNDRGNTWSANKGATRVATDVPWLANANENFMSVGDVIMDPLIKDKLWFSEGIGVWFSTDQTGPVVIWTSQSAGIEEIVANQIICPPGGVPVIACWDRPLFRITNPDVYPSHHGPDESININVASSIDWTSSDPNTMVVNNNRFNGEHSGISKDGGQSWKDFTGQLGPGAWWYQGYLSGCIAASSPSKIMRVQANDGDVYYTTDGGANWIKVAASVWGNGAINAPGYTGWHHADYLYRQSLCADRVAPDTFYIFNSQDATQGGGIYKVTFPNGVFTPVRVNTAFTAPTPNAFNLIMTAVPGFAGHVFFTTGEGQSGTTGFQRSIDGCSTFTKIANVGETHCFGFGKPATGKDYPSVYLVGFVNGQYGIYRADASLTEWTANNVSWTLLGQFPLNCLSQIKTICGDPNIWGRCYLGTPTGGCFYYS